MNERDDLVELLHARKFPWGGRPDGFIWIDANAAHAIADFITSSGYRKIFDGDCGLSNIKDPTEREAAEAWMRWANIVTGNDGNGIAAMQQMLTELGYRKPSATNAPEESAAEES